MDINIANDINWTCVVDGEEREITVEIGTSRPYIMTLRDVVGHRPLIYCAGSVIVEDKKGRVLLGRRADNHCWGYSGGGVELGESVEECACRELYEEMGLKAEKLELFTVLSGRDAHWIYGNGDEVYFVDSVFICRKYSGTPTPQPGEVDELRFFAPEEIEKEMISPPILRVFEKYLRRKLE